MPSSNASLVEIEVLEKTVKTLLATLAGFDPQTDGHMDLEISDLQFRLADALTRLSVVKKQVIGHMFFREWRKNVMDKVKAAPGTLEVKIRATRAQIVDLKEPSMGKDGVERVIRRMERWAVRKGLKLIFWGDRDRQGRTSLETIGEVEEGNEGDDTGGAGKDEDVVMEDADT